MFVYMGQSKWKLYEGVWKLLYFEKSNECIHPYLNHSIDDILVSQLGGEEGGQVPFSYQLPPLGPVAAPHFIQSNENDTSVKAAKIMKG